MAGELETHSPQVSNPQASSLTLVKSLGGNNHFHYQHSLAGFVFLRRTSQCGFMKELEEVRAEVDAEFEVEDRLLKKRKRQNKVQRSSTEDDLGSLFGGSINRKLPRALGTINVREELEKLNVWVAYFNSENEYGNPP